MYLVQEFDRERTQQLSDLLTDPSLVNIYIRSKTFADECDKEDRWFKTKYTNSKFSDDLVNLMKNPNA